MLCFYCGSWLIITCQNGNKVENPLLGYKNTKTGCWALFYSFSGGVSSLMLAYFLKILTEKIPVFSILPRMPIYLKIYAAYFLKHYLHLFFNSMKGPQWIKIMRIIKTKNQIRGNPGLCLANQILTKQRPGPLLNHLLSLGYF